MIERIRGTSSDLKIKTTSIAGLDDPEKVKLIVEAIPGVVATVPYVETLVVYELKTRGFINDHHLHLQVMDLRKEASVGKLDEYIWNYASRNSIPGYPQTLEATLDRKWVEDNLWKYTGKKVPEEIRNIKPILLGEETIRYLSKEMLLGDLLELKTISPVTSLPRDGLFVIAGFFKSRDVLHDSQTVLMDLEDAIEFLALENYDTGTTSITGLRVFLEESNLVDDVKKDVQDALLKADVPFIRAETWREEKQKVLNAVATEKTIVGVILGVIVIFVSLMIFIIMTVQIVEKIRDLGVLQAIGVPPAGIIGLYMRIGLIICLVGISTGVLYGVGFCYYIDTLQRWVYVLTGKEVFPKTIYYIDSIPVRLVLSDFLFIILPTVLFSFLASLLAAVRATRKSPLEALRSE